MTACQTQALLIGLLRDAAGHANGSITSAYLHAADEDEGLGQLFVWLESRARQNPELWNW
jgi:hypothetical protein